MLAATAWLAWTSLPRELFERGAWLLAGVVIYFGVVHCGAVHSGVAHWRLHWPKEAAVAVIFGLGASLAAWTRVETSYDVFTVILFACLCWINCAAIAEWEVRLGPMAYRRSGGVRRTRRHRRAASRAADSGRRRGGQRRRVCPAGPRPAEAFRRRPARARRCGSAQSRLFSAAGRIAVLNCDSDRALPIAGSNTLAFGANAGAAPLPLPCRTPPARGGR